MENSLRLTGLGALLFLVGIALANCDSGRRKPRERSSSTPRREEIRINSDEKQVLIDDIARFGVSLFVRGDAKANAVSSPIGIARVLAMAYVGAAGKTRLQMKDVLGPNLEPEKFHHAMTILANDLGRFDKSKAHGAKPKRPALKLAQSIWLRSGISPKPSFLKALQAHYDTTARPIDFTNPEATADAVNRWVAEQTAGKIDSLIARGDVKPDLALLLASVVRFESIWAQPFPSNTTRSRTFKRLDMSSIEVPMMHFKRNYPYAAGDGFEIVDLYYAGNELFMRIVLPDQSRYFEILKRLREGDTGFMNRPTEPRELCLALPKFNFSSSGSLTQHLNQMGMHDAFSRGIADFSGIAGTNSVFISQVIERSYIAVDELGTEAASAAVGIVVRSRHSECEKELIVDRPFIFLVRDAKRLPIFIGRVTDPNAQ